MKAPVFAGLSPSLPPQTRVSGFLTEMDLKLVGDDSGVGLGQGHLGFGAGCAGHFANFDDALSQTHCLKHVDNFREPT